MCFFSVFSWPVTMLSAAEVDLKQQVHTAARAALLFVCGSFSSDSWQVAANHLSSFIHALSTVFMINVVQLKHCLYQGDHLYSLKLMDIDRISVLVS